MSAKICCLCQSNMALELDRQKALFGRTFEDEDGESPCVECIQEGLSENDRADAWSESG